MKDWSYVNLKLFLDYAFNSLICNDFVLEGSLSLLAMPSLQMKCGRLRAGQLAAQAWQKSAIHEIFQLQRDAEIHQKAGQHIQGWKYASSPFRAATSSSYFNS